MSNYAGKTSLRTPLFIITVTEYRTKRIKTKIDNKKFKNCSIPQTNIRRYKQMKGDYPNIKVVGKNAETSKYLQH
jgi:hypothetical protein